MLEVVLALMKHLRLLHCATYLDVISFGQKPSVTVEVDVAVNVVTVFSAV